MRGLICMLPDGYVTVATWLPHPCGGYYCVEALCYGPRGAVGRWMG